MRVGKYGHLLHVLEDDSNEEYVSQTPPHDDSDRGNGFVAVSLSTGPS